MTLPQEPEIQVDEPATASPQGKLERAPESHTRGAAARPMVGIVVSDRKVLVSLRVAIERLNQLGLEVRGCVLGPVATKSYGEWLEAFAEGGLGLWVVVSNRVSLVPTATTAYPVRVPVYAQVIGGDAATKERDLLSLAAPAALLPSNQPLLAVQALEKLAALTTPSLRSLMDFRVTGEAKEAKDETTAFQTEIDELLMQRPLPQPKLPRRKPAPAPPPEPDRDYEAEMREIAASFVPKVITREERPKPPEKQKVLDYSLSLRKLLASAREIAADNGNPAVHAEHLLAAIIDLPETTAHQALLLTGVGMETLAKEIFRLFPTPTGEEVIPGAFALHASAEQVLAGAKLIARDRERPCLTTLDFLEALAQSSESLAAQALETTNIALADLVRAITSYGPRAECAHIAAEQPQDFLTTEQLAAAQPQIIEPRKKRPVEPAQVQQPTLSTESTESPQSTEPSPSAAPPPASRPRMLVTSAAMPGMEEVEIASDAILEGRLVAVPMDTMFALVADATNPSAVTRLREVANLPHERPVGVIVHSMAQVRHVAHGISTEESQALEELWPGPLTVVLKKHPNGFLHLNRAPTVALRIPGDFLSLSLLSNVGRPLAVTSIDLDEAGGALGAKQVADRMAGKIDAVLDTREAPESVTTTVISLAEEKPTVLRQGAVPIEKLRGYFGELV